MSRRPGPGWTVLVTGASSGLGRAIAEELAEAGCALLLTGRDQRRLAAAAEACRERGVFVEWKVADLSHPEGVERLMRDWAPDALVNNAGAGFSGRWESAAEAQDTALIQVLVNSPLALTKALLPAWRARGRGAVLNIGSTGAFQPGPLTAVYYASKAFLVSWSLALAREERWLIVTTLCPGAMKTGFARSAGKQDIPGAPGPQTAARAAVRAWRQGRGLIVPGLFNKVAVLVSRLLPPSWTAALVERVQRSVL